MSIARNADVYEATLISISKAIPESLSNTEVIGLLEKMKSVLIEIEMGRGKT